MRCYTIVIKRYSSWAGGGGRLARQEAFRKLLGEFDYRGSVRDSDKSEVAARICCRRRASLDQNEHEVGRVYRRRIIAIIVPKRPRSPFPSNTGKIHLGLGF